MALGTAMEVSLLQKSTVVPNKPTNRQQLFLSAFDIKFETQPYSPRVFFYHSPRIVSQDLDWFEHITSHLKDSLSRVLVHFYPFAGRLTLAEDGSGRLAIDCNDAGVEFMKACANFRIEQLGDLRIDEFPADVLRVGGDTVEDLEFCEKPLFWTQVTKFQCGGVCVSCAFNHIVADGQSFWHFMKSWVEVCRGNCVSLLPFHDRKMLNINDLPAARTRARSTDGKQTKRAPEDKNSAFYISREGLTRVKQLANSSGGRGDECLFSSLEAFCAHFWRAVTRARLLPHDQETVFATLINFRRMLDPPLPDTYLGNAVFWAFAVAKSGDLINSNLSFAAGLIHNSVDSCDDAAIRKELESLERQDNSTVWVPSVYDLMVGSSPRFPLYETDFGWGKPSLVRKPDALDQGCMVADPGGAEEGDGHSCSASSVVVSLELRGEVVQRLKADPEFLLFWTPLC